MQDKKQTELTTLTEKIKNINNREVEEKEEETRIEEWHNSGQKEHKRKKAEKKKTKERGKLENIEIVKTKDTNKGKRERGIVITERDREILSEISRWKCILGKQIKILSEFDGQRACDRRLAKLIDSGYLERKRYIYGISGIYNITPKAKKQFNISLPIGEIRLDQIEHDIAVTDTVIYFIKNKGIEKSNIISEKQLRNEQGFTTRTHLPDFIFKKGEKTYCVEVEMSLKAKNRLENNIKQNYMNYEKQNWIVPNNKVKIREILKDNENKYPNIEIIELEEVQNYVKTLE